MTLCYSGRILSRRDILFTYLYLMGFLLADGNELAVVDPEFIFSLNPFRMQKRILICSSFTIHMRWENCSYFHFPIVSSFYSKNSIFPRAQFKWYIGGKVIITVELLSVFEMGDYLLILPYSLWKRWLIPCQCTLSYKTLSFKNNFNDWGENKEICWCIVTFNYEYNEKYWWNFRKWRTKEFYDPSWPFG